MDAQTQNAITTSRKDAAFHTITKQLHLAENHYRRIIDTVEKYEGREATYADRYNLAHVLVMRHKYQEAESILRDTLKYLAQRPADDDDSSHLLEQEDGTVRLLVQSLQGQGKNEEADKLMAGAHYSSREEQLQVRKRVYGLAA
jgi:hypothetical protein